MTKHPPISIFALQTPEERARTERLAEALEECGPNEVKAAYRRLGLEEPVEVTQEQAPALPEPETPGHSERRETGFAQWLRAHGAIAACLAVLVAIGGVYLGYNAGWDGATDASTAAQEQAAAEAQAIEDAQLAKDLEQREKNVKTRYKKLGIDTSRGLTAEDVKRIKALVTRQTKKHSAAELREELEELKAIFVDKEV
jgi:uncharacterized protein HemX